MSSAEKNGNGNGEGESRAARFGRQFTAWLMATAAAAFLAAGGAFGATLLDHEQRISALEATFGSFEATMADIRNMIRENERQDEINERRDDRILEAIERLVDLETKENQP